jgi:hypothetical protein
MASTKTKHTTIYAATAATVATKILGVRQAGVPDGQASQIDVSSWDDDFDQFVSGRKSTGSTTIEVVFDATAHEALDAKYHSGEVMEWLVLAPLSDSAPAVAPTVVDGAFAAVTTVDNIKFSGYISNFAVAMADNDVWRGTITIQGTGPRTITKKA